MTKTFPAGVVPQTVTEYLFVEGISHRVTPETHVVTIYTGPATTYLQWLLGNYTITQTRTNLVTNPSFEVDTTGWTARNFATIARTTSQAYLGSASLQITTSSSTNNGATLLTNLSVSASTAYAFSAYAKVESGTLSNCFIQVIWLNSGGAEISRTVGTFTTITTSWSRLNVSGTSPVGTVTARCDIIRNTAGAGLIWFIDAVLFEASASALPYFDGTYADPYTGYTLTYQAWDGTANTSTSTTVWGLNSSGTGSALGDTTYGLA